MKHIKKIFLTILSFCILSSHILASAAPYDVDDAYILKVLHTLGCFDILYESDSTGNFRPDDPVLRAEAVGDVLKLIGREVTEHGDNATAKFNDVDKNSEYFNTLQTAADCGLIVGYGVDFRPKSNISYTELIKMLCVALGYDNAAKLNGGYPNGYVQIAGQIGLNKNVTVAGGELTRRDYAVILYNALTAPMMVLSGNMNETEISENDTLLSEVHKAYSGEGVVTANGYTTLYTPGGVGKTFVQIGDEKFSVGDTDAVSLIGCYVEYLVKEDEYGDYVLLDIWADRERVVQLNSTEILPERCGMGAVYYTPKGTSKVDKYNLETNADLIYNGLATDFNDVSLITPNVGAITLSDTDNDDDYDVIIVTDYTIQLADRVSATTEKIHFKDNSGTLPMDGTGYAEIEITKDGSEINYTDIKEWDVLHIAYPPTADRGKLQIVVNSKTAAGKLTRKSDNTITIDETEYEIGNGYSAQRLPLSKAGQSVIAMLDIFGRIVDFQPVADVEVCGYLYGVSYDQNEEKGFFTIFTESGEWLRCESTDKISLNGASKNIEDAVKALQCKGDARGVKVDADGFMIDVWGRFVNYAADGSFVTVENGVLGEYPLKDITERQMVMYSINGEGKLNRITTADAASNGKSFITHGDYTASPGLEWREGMRAFYIYNFGGSVYPSFYADEDTRMFMIPFDYPDNFNLYQIKIADQNFLHSDDYRCYAKTYGFEDDLLHEGIPYMMVEFGGDSDLSAPVVVEKVLLTVNDEDEQVYKIIGYQLGKQVEIYAESADIITKPNGKMIGFGDLIDYYAKSDGTVKNLNTAFNSTIIHDASAPFDDQMGGIGTYRGSVGKITGYVTGVDYSKRRIAIHNGETSPDGQEPIVGLWRTWSTSWVYVIDMTAETITVGNIDSVEIDDRVACRVGNSNVRAVAVYRN